MPEYGADLFQLQVRCAEVFAQRGQWEQMAEVLIKALPTVAAPRSIGERLEKFRVLIALKRYSEAITEADAIQREELSHRTLETLKFPWSGVLVSHPASRSTLDVDRHILRDLIRRGTSAPWAHYYLSQLTHKSSPEHIASLDAVASRPPGPYGWMWREVGILRLEEFDYAAALKAFRVAARATRPPSWRSLAFSAETHAFLGRIKAAQYEFLRAIEAAPDIEKGEALAWMGELLLWLGRYAEALTLFERAIPRGGLYAYCWRGAAKLMQGRTDEALADLDLALKFHPRDREGYLWRGEARRIAGDFEGALEDLSAEPLRGVSCSRWLWHDFNRALVHGAMGNEKAMIADFDAIPGRVIRYVARRIGMSGRSRYTTKDRVQILEAGLRMARGYRRPEEHGQAVWMGAEGRRRPRGRR